MLSTRVPALGCSCNDSLVKGEEEPPRVENTDRKFSGNSVVSLHTPDFIL